MATKTQTTSKRRAPGKNPDPAGAATELVQEKTARMMSPFGDIEQVFERAFENFFPRNWMTPIRWELPYWGEFTMPFEGKYPRIDVIDHDHSVVVKAELPGMEKDNIDISMTAHTVTINGSSSHKKEEKEEEYYRCEISKGTFARTVPLPCDVDGSRARADFKNGILELTLPKVEKAKRRRITIQ